MTEPYLKVFLNRSELVDSDGVKSIYQEGRTSQDAASRLSIVKEHLNDGFLDKAIDRCRETFGQSTHRIPEAHACILKNLVESLTSEVGRALVGLTVLQLVIKTVCPEQSVRLHKGGRGAFAWVEGIPMRTLDKSFITPVLRKHGLLRLNADGFMMTRSLAENYPYSKLYKAAIRGARHDWLETVDLLENGEMDPASCLDYFLGLLINQSEIFKKISEETCKLTETYIDTKNPTVTEVITLMKEFIHSTDYSARVFEVSIHSFYQVLDEKGLLAGRLKPLQQMRSANKKHGNIGDIEVLFGQGDLDIIEAWDAKYGKPYLYEELSELQEKLCDHPETELVGFITDSTPNLRKDILKRKEDVEALHNVTIELIEFNEWAYKHLPDEGKRSFAHHWLIVFSECICQKRRNIAPIDEPSENWVKDFYNCVKNML